MTTEYFPGPAATAPYLKPEPAGRTITETETEAYAHCGRVIRNTLCEGNAQQRVRVILTETTETIGFRNGGPVKSGISEGLDAMLSAIVEASRESLRWADPDDAPCPSCGNPRELTRQERPDVPVLIGGPDALLRVKQVGAVIQPARAEALAQGAPETPLELLQRRYVSGEIEADDFQQRRSVLLGGPVAPLDCSESNGADSAPEPPEGIRTTASGKYQAIWRDADGKQRSATYEDLEDAIEAREQALAERGES